MLSEEDIKYHKFLNLLLVIKNSISLICFTILAIIFKKWWIIFFALLFLSSIGKSEDKKDE